jgi:hypothetical protein
MPQEQRISYQKPRIVLSGHSLTGKIPTVELIVTPNEVKGLTNEGISGIKSWKVNLKGVSEQETLFFKSLQFGNAPLDLSVEPVRDSDKKNPSFSGRVSIEVSTGGIVTLKGTGPLTTEPNRFFIKE